MLVLHGDEIIFEDGKDFGKIEDILEVAKPPITITETVPLVEAVPQKITATILEEVK